MWLQRKSFAYIRRIFRMTLHYERCTKTFRCQTKNVARSDPNVGRSEREDVTLWNGTSVHVTVFWEATPYSVAKVYRYSSVNYHHHRPTFFSARKWKQQDPPNRRNILYQITRLHIPPGFTFTVTAVRNRNPRKSVHFNNNFSLNYYLQRPLSAIFFSQKRPVRLWGSPFIVFLGCKSTLPGVKL